MSFCWESVGEDSSTKAKASSPRKKWKMDIRGERFSCSSRVWWPGIIFDCAGVMSFGPATATVSDCLLKRGLIEDKDLTNTKGRFQELR